jgi:hypothetical protein
MKIYISHSTSFDYKKELYQPIKKASFDYNFIFPHDKNIKQHYLKKLFSSNKYKMVIADVSFPSTGQGIELGWANFYKIPIICIYKNGSNYSKSLNSISKKFIKYKDSEDLVEKLKKIL